MDNIISTFSNEPIYLIIFVIITLLVLYSLVKKIAKLMVFGLFILGCYVGYIVYTGRDIPVDAEGLKKALSEDANKAKQGLKDQSNKLLDKAKDGVKEELKKEAKEELEKMDAPQKDTNPKE